MPKVDAHGPCACETIPAMQAWREPRIITITLRGLTWHALFSAGELGRANLQSHAHSHSGTEESMMSYAHHTLPNLTACMHSPYSYILCVSEAKMAARWPPTPSPRVTATGVDSAGPIGFAQTGIGFHPGLRMGDGWAYLVRSIHA